MWQVCSLCLSLNGTYCSLISEYSGYYLPLLQLFLTYISVLFCHLFKEKGSNMGWLRYIIVSIFSLAGDIASIYTYSLTSIASSVILATTVIFWVAPMNFFFLRRNLTWVQGVCILTGMGGVVCVVISDGFENDKWIGNVLALSSAICYAIANILQEYLVYEASVSTLMFRFSLLCSPLAAIACSAFEWRKIYNFEWKYQSILLIIIYVVGLTFYYMFVPVILQHSSATEMNMSLLTSNLFSIIISYFVFGDRFKLLYIAGFILIPASIFLFCYFRPQQEYRNAGIKIHDESNHEESNTNQAESKLQEDGY